MSIIARSTKMKALCVRCECPNKTERTETTWGAVWRSRVTALMGRGAETENARLPTVERRMRGTAKWWEEDDRNCCLDVMSATWVKQDCRYLGAVPWMDRYVRRCWRRTVVHHMNSVLSLLSCRRLDCIQAETALMHLVTADRNVSTCDVWWRAGAINLGIVGI